MPASSISTIKRVLEILDLFDDQRSTLTVSSIVEELGRPKSTVYRQLEVLEEAGLIEEKGPGGTYRLGLKLLSLARLVRANLTWAEVALPIMRDLCRSTGETVILTVPYGLHGMYMEQVESPHPLHMTYERGKVVSLNAGATCKAILAFMDEPTADEVIKHGLKRFTANTITDPNALRSHLVEIRNAGYAVSSEEFISGTRGVGAPVYNIWGKVVAAIGIAGPIQRMPTAKVPQLAQQVMDSASRIRKLGWY